MTGKSVKGSVGGEGGDGTGGGDGGGGGSEGVASDSKSDAPSAESAESTASGKNGGGDLHWLLPNIAEAIEILERATAQEVQAKIEELTSVKYTNSDLTLGLENGTQLGLFEVKREFSLNHQYLNSEFIAENDKELVSFVKKKLRKEYELAGNTNLARDNRKGNKRIRKSLSTVQKGKKKRPRQKMCDRCRKRVNIMAENKSNAESYSSASVQSLKSGKSSRKTTCPGKRLARQEEYPVKRKKDLSPSSQEYIARPGHHYQSDNVRKSKLFVETNPLKKEPPDIMFL